MTELIKSGLKYKANRPDQFNTLSLASATELADHHDLPLPSGTSRQQVRANLPPVETIQRELASARSIDDFFGKQGILARLFASTISELMEAELTEHLGYARYTRQGQGNSRKGKRPRTL